MKRLQQINISARTALSAAVLALAAVAAFAAPSKPPSRIEVSWAPPEQLAEVKNNQFNRGWLRTDDWEQRLGDHLRKTADRILPPDQQLQVHVNDISLAGSFEPWHQPGTQDIRILKDIYPPWLNLHYTLLAADGSTIREGDAKLRDGSYLQRDPPGYASDPLRYDKRMIDDWLSSEFKPAKKSG
jgi:hypothetical protein